MREGIKETTEEDMRNGEIKEMEDIESSAFALTGIYNGLIYRWLITGTEKSLLDDFSVIDDVYFNGIEKK